MDERLEFEGDRLLAVLHDDGAIVLIDNMKDNAVIGLVGGVMVLFPVGRAEMEFDISSPFDTADGDPGVEEIGSRIAVEFTGAMDDNRLAIGGGQPSAKHLVLPDIM